MLSLIARRNCCRTQPIRPIVRTRGSNIKFFSTGAACAGGGGEIKKVTVISGGHMGAGIVQLNAQNGYRVTVVDSDEFLQKCEVQIAKSLDIMKKMKFPDELLAQNNWRNAVISNITTTRLQNLSTACQDADIVIESVVEKMEVKKKIFSQINNAVSDTCIIASNTSALPITDIAAGVTRPDRVVGLHFFTPVWKMRLVEIIAMAESSPETLGKITSYIGSLGKVPINCSDTKGSTVNWLLYHYFVNAIRYKEETGVSVEDIDKAMRLGAGLPQGPFELMDRIGIDIVLQVVTNWSQKYSDDPRLLPTISTLSELIKNRKYGRKTSRGFYDYTVRR